MTDITPVQVQQIHDQNSLLQAADDLFAGTAATSVTLPKSGLVVEISHAKVKHLRQITAFVVEFISGFQTSEMLALITKVSEFQQKAIQNGVSPYALGTTDMIKEVVGSAGVLGVVMKNSIDKLPELLPMFSSITPAQLDELDLDEATLVAFHVFGSNYHFFTLQVLPLIRGCIAQTRAQANREKKGPAASI